MIEVKVIPHDEQRYETCGDYWMDTNGVLQVRVSALGDWRYEFLVAFHEIAEFFLCKWAGIEETAIMLFDEKFEAEREQGLHGPDDEPGDAPDAPYRLQHSMATAVERAISVMLGVDWEAYDSSVMVLYKEKPAAGTGGAISSSN